MCMVMQNPSGIMGIPPCPRLVKEGDCAQSCDHGNIRIGELATNNIPIPLPHCRIKLSQRFSALQPGARHFSQRSLTQKRKDCIECSTINKTLAPCCFQTLERQTDVVSCFQAHNVLDTQQCRVCALHAHPKETSIAIWLFHVAAKHAALVRERPYSS